MCFKTLLPNILIFFVEKKNIGISEILFEILMSR